MSLFLAGTAHATGTSGWYASLEGGGVWVDEWNHLRTKITRCWTTTTPAEASFSTGWAALGAIGYGMSNWRVEFEGGYRHNELDQYTKNGWLLKNSSGELTEATAMLNVIYDVPLMENLSLSLGVGAGGDFAHLKLDLPWQDIDQEDWHFAYQGLAGLNYALTGSMGVFLNYRFLNAESGTYDPTPSLHVEGDEFQKHTASVGIRYAFAAPAVAFVPPPPPPPLAPAPVENEFQVFFGFNKSQLTPQALATVRNAAKAAQRVGQASIRVVGHTDRSGSVSYNMALSLRRANSVKRALVTEGIAGSAISISGRGESEPIVPTADGVRESQNRRVQINF
jgi:outer membrane protein OmpA-like peptidoglycan-associated protein